ncbi:MAG TPA: DMT family transporter [Flavipsychrobacter sp.]|nr:DMT family transporter [Flavipsychrobacter sp.]
MLYLIATVLINTFLFSLFKVFPKYKVDALQAIVVNYFTCVLTGSIFLQEFPISQQSVSQPWFPWAALMGAMFFSLFNLIAWRTREDGLTTTTVANKLSLVIPVLFSLFLYDERFSVMKGVGIAVAFPAVYLTTRVAKEDKTPRGFLFPALLFIGSGLLDTLVKYTEHTFLSSSHDQAAYTIHVFAAASILGIIVVGTLVARKKTELHWRNIIAGVILGVPNYFSIFLLIKLLHSDFLQSSAAIPVNNIGIVLLSSITAILFFKEKLTWQRLLGLILSIAAILLIALSDMNGRI